METQSRSWGNRLMSEEDNQAVCTFLSGAERRLPAEVRSAEEIFVVTMQPPCLREIVKIKFFQPDGTEGREVEALVTQISYRPTDVRGCGFTATVTGPESLFSVPPETSVLRSVDVSLAPATGAERLEKRRDPRIRTKAIGAVYLAGRTLTTRILNLSMSGALLGFDKDQIPPEMTQGVLFRMDAYDAHGDTAVSLKGEIIRLIGVGRPSNAGVRFIDVDPETRDGIERIILNEIQLQSLLDSENSIHVENPVRD